LTGLVLALTAGFKPANITHHHLVICG